MATLPQLRSGEWLLAFDGYLVRQGRATGTRLKYGHALTQFETWLSDRPPSELSSEELDRYLESWQTQFVRRHGRWPSRATYRAQVCALRAFFAWLERFDLLRDAEGRPLPDPMRHITAPAAGQKKNDWLRPAEDRALLGVECSSQERIVVWLLRWTGLRVSEATRLLVSDVDLTPGEECLIVRESKTPAGRRTIVIVPELLPQIHAWLRHLEVAGLLSYNTPLLATKHGTAVKPSYVWRVVKRVAFRAGVRPVPCSCGIGNASRHRKGCRRTQSGENLSGVSPHTLRRTFGSHLLNRGLRLEVISKLLGHSSTTVTEHAYAELLYETARREVLRALGHGE